ncbi:MAG TPA: hypothetical protein VGX28_03965 [Frankiaceae bacterium]|jgi:hypothetical protein|nr:hypothetical protein [Frankiaceae bacterium]
MEAAEFRGPAGVLAVILLEFALGSLGVLVVAPVWGVVKRGYFLLVGWSVVVCALLARLSAGGALSRIGESGSFASYSMWAFLLLSAVTLALLHARSGLARWAGALAAVLGLVAVLAIADLRGVGSTEVGGLAAMVTGAAFLGATWDGMLLGHWYLVDRKLTNDPMRWHAWAYTAGCALALVSAGLAKGGRPTGSEASLNPLLLVSDLTLYLAFGLVAVCALLAFFTHKLVNEGSIRAATGMLYLAVIMAFAAEFAAKARFFTI